MSRAALTIAFAVIAVVGFAAQQAAPPPAAPPPVPDAPAAATDPAKLAASPPVAPPVPPASATDPAKLAEPKPAPGAKAPNAVPVDEKTYTIGPEDVLAISVWEQPQLSVTCTVRPDGMITVPVIQEIKADGLTLLELRQKITEELSSHLNDPLVTVSLVGEHSKKYYLSGQLKSQGMKELIMPTTVLEAIISAGGFADFANQKNITIVRGAKRFKFNYKEVMAGKHLEQNIYLENGDMIVVK